MGALPKRKISTYRKGKRRVHLKRQFARAVSSQISIQNRLKTSV